MKTGIFLWGVLAFTTLTPVAFAGPKLSVALIDYAPFEADAQQHGRWGYVPEVILEIFGKAGFDVTFEIVPWKRAILDTESGTYDAMPMVNAGHSRLLILSKEKSAVLRQTFFVKKGEPWRYAGVKSLEGITVGWVLGYNYSTFSEPYQTYLDRHHDDTNRVIYTAGDTASADMIRKLQLGRVTTFNEDETFFQYTVGQAPDLSLSDFEAAGSLGTNAQFMGFSPANPNAARYAELFDQGIRDLRQSGALKKILDGYGVSDWQP